MITGGSTMKKLLLAFATISALATASTANAQYYNRGYYHGGGQNWVAPFVGGAIVGGIIGGALVAPPPPPPVIYVPAPPQPQECWQEFLYYDRWNRPVFRTVCR